MPKNKEAFDLIVSADVFTYLGDLSGLFCGIAFALKSKGLAIFTVSENTDNPDVYALEPSGRFMHGKEYVKNELQKNGLNVSEMSSVELRQELGKPVLGLLIVAVKI